jgi:hypothetical protein
MATMPAEPRTVGDLIQRLEAFDRDLPVVVANALTGTSDNFNWILMVGPLPPENEKIGVIYLPQEQELGSEPRTSGTVVPDT